VPVLLLITLLGLSAILSNAFLPGFQIIGIILGFVAGYFEEIGWTGFALPELLKKHSPIKAGIILGLLWGMWHFLADYLGASATLGVTWLPTFFFRYLMALVAYRILMVWVYCRVKSVFLAQLMHGCFSGSLYLLGPISSNENAVIWNAVFAVVLWIFTIYVVVIRNRKMITK
jgi:membrane protease YdiL (CAAX protease family)